MIIYESLKLAMRAIKANLMRSLLTILGVIIGVASIIVMISIGTGSKVKVATQLEKMGTNNLSVRAGSISRSGIRAGAGTANNLVHEDAIAIKQLSTILASAPVARGDVQTRFRSNNWPTLIEGVTPDYFYIREWNLISGQMFTESQLKNASKVCILGNTVAKELFGLKNPLGQIIILNSTVCVVQGILEAKGASSWGRDMDDIIFSPIKMVQHYILGYPALRQIMVKVESRDQVKLAENSIRELMRERHKLQTDEPDDFMIRNRAELAEAAEGSAKVFSILLASIALVSMVVGGIGIMNIMLVSVTERYREIGIRRALGASKVNILFQFQFESIILTVLGGAIGIVLGVIVSYIVSSLTELPVIITLNSIFISFLFSVLIGLFFGLNPARKAANLSPQIAITK